MAAKQSRVAPTENVLLVHWHDLGRHLGAYGYPEIQSPRLDRLARDGILFTRAHATAPLCSPSRGSLFTGLYPQRNGLVGLAHHGWEYRHGVRTLPAILSQNGWHTTLFGMQHETSFPARLGFDEYDVSNSYCEYVVQRSVEWLRRNAIEKSRHPQQHKPFLLTAGFFETHRPYPADRYRPADGDTLTVPPYLPDNAEVRADVAEFYGSIAVADAAVGLLLDELTAQGLDKSTWVVFVTDHGPAFPRAKSTLYDPGTGIALIVRPPSGRNVAPHIYDELFSGVDLVPTLLELLGLDAGDEDSDGFSHADRLLEPRSWGLPVRSQVFTSKTYHDSFDPIRAVRTKDYSYIENYANRPELDLPWDIADSPSGQAVAGRTGSTRAQRELYDLRADPHERRNLLAESGYEGVAAELALRLHTWREFTGDVIPSEFVGERISERYTQDYAWIHGISITSRSPRGANRGFDREHDSASHDK